MKRSPIQPKDPIALEPEAPAKRPYTPPRLEAYGDVRDLTLGATPGFGESVGSTVRKSQAG